MKCPIVRNVSILLFFSLLMVSGCNTKKKVDLLLHHAHIYTVDDQFTIYEAMAVDKGKIIATGTDIEIQDSYEGKEVIDAEGKTVYPGFVDAHCHLLEYGLGLQQAELTGTTSFKEVIEKLKTHQKQYPMEWVLGWGWDQNDWPVQKFPDKSLLDKIFPDKPVYIVRIDGHAALANSKALEIAGINTSTKIKGGEILKDKNGLTGVLIDNAKTLIEKVLPLDNNSTKTTALLRAQQNCFGVGLTSLDIAGLYKNDVLLIDSLQKAGKLKLRIYAMLHPIKENMEYFMKKGYYKTDRLDVRSIKLYTDGALGSRGALLLKPYTDDPENYGLLLHEKEYYTHACSTALEYNYQVNTHCIGDSANRMILNIYGSFLKGKNDRRWRIEHTQVIDPADFYLFGKYSIIPSVQTTHATSDMYWAGERLGKERLKSAYAYRRLLEQNGWLPNGSDFPVESINPLYGFYAGVTRQDLKGYPQEGFQKNDALTREQALKAMTIWAAKAAFEENEKGSLEPGKWADFVITDQDIMTVPEPAIPRTKVLETFIGGEQVFSK
jgi:predicted amidohydrolase YtcJ